MFKFHIVIDFRSLHQSISFYFKLIGKRKKVQVEEEKQFYHTLYHSCVQCNSILNVFLVHNKEHKGGNQTLSKQRKGYKGNVNINYFISDFGK